ncbi:branched-chain amino acid ABC transporter permease [Nitrospira sp. KM1]|uniref:urea ABC transporter permease subunit UrtB n=1 Tax=Nitrospira sp. KM1 TaxID=1936990 RepID=UPI0013A75D64|nr:urea ABC transporter permease subunit UrtB [Nitrospira sp. KM1]BCA56772.1 branched-chain amino acid ABC transporter permease [Nitrospira sp. KM1]
MRQAAMVWAVILCLAQAGTSALAADSSAQPVIMPLEQALTQITSEDDTVRDTALAAVIQQGDATLLPRLDEIRAGAERPIRLAIKPVMDLIRNRSNLDDPASHVRRSAATDLGTSGRVVAIPWLEAAAAKEDKKWVRYTMQEAAALLKLSLNDQASKLEAIDTLGALSSQNGVPALQEMMTAGRASNSTDAQKELAKRSSAAIERIETWGAWSNAIETIFRGISLSSILLIMSVGLAIVFGLMGVINMAHGELMMVGAYATFLTQELFKSLLPPAMFDYYFAFALPVAFVLAALSGLILEATVIRFLYGRPLETMLATWGVSLVLMQAARVYFGDLTAVVAPGWLSGGQQVMVGVFFPNNRLFIIALSIICVLGIYGLLFRSNLGLRVRAVTQNRNMSACLGIPTRKVDAYTFAFGSGLAGIAGWALTLIGNVEPGLGQNYIVDSFMVVVTGGVGKLAGTIVAALGIGGLNKVLEPSLGAVYGKVCILVLVILFLQWRPSGLFAIKGRHADS